MNISYQRHTVPYFSQLNPARRDRLFLSPPEAISDGDPRLLATALGATQYLSGYRRDLVGDIFRSVRAGAGSLVIDVDEPATAADGGSALDNTISALDEIAFLSAAKAMVFVRVTELDQIARVSNSLTARAGWLSGFVIPNFSTSNGFSFLTAIAAASRKLGRDMYCMPILESADLARLSSRDDELTGIAKILSTYRRQVLAVGIGTANANGALGIRRDASTTIYDVRIVARVIADIVKHLGRADESGFVITGPAYEHFADPDSLLRELRLDRINGLSGKTAIHPSQLVSAHAYSVVTHDEHVDATAIMAAEGYGHAYRGWAEQVLRRVKVFGVARPGVTLTDLVAASSRPLPLGGSEGGRTSRHLDLVAAEQER